MQNSFSELRILFLVLIFKGLLDYAVISVGILITSLDKSINDGVGGANGVV